MSDKWMDWAIELQALAQDGIAYSQNPYDIDRFKRIREISAEIVAAKTDNDLEHVRDVFLNEKGYQTPKLCTRAAVFRDGKILMTREKPEGTWSLPGGWVDSNLTVRQNAAKEALEEAGAVVEPERVIALHDRRLRNPGKYIYGITKVFVICRLKEISFTENLETSEADFFAEDQLPDNISVKKNTKEQILMCFRHYKNPTLPIEFD